jgi:hypothetical protein
MTVNEFKAFLEGMDVQEQPTPEQWKRLMGKVEQLVSSGNVVMATPDFLQGNSPTQVIRGGSIFATDNTIPLSGNAVYNTGG